MNGRIYDAFIGRFLSADPFVQSPGNLQSYNRYSYVANNPLSYTDPSGFFLSGLFKSIGNFFKKFWRPIVAIIIIVVAIVFIQPELILLLGPLLGKVATGAIVGAAIGGLYGGAKGALFGAITGAAFALIGSVDFQDIFKDRIFAHLAEGASRGVTGGLLSEVKGGEFLNGFASSALNYFANTGIRLAATEGLDAVYGESAGLSTVGGTVSSTGGGKFENGGATSSFGLMYSNGTEALTDPGSPFVEYLGGVSDAWYGYLAGGAETISFGLLKLPIDEANANMTLGRDTGRIVVTVAEFVTAAGAFKAGVKKLLARRALKNNARSSLTQGGEFLDDSLRFGDKVVSTEKLIHIFDAKHNLSGVLRAFNGDKVELFQALQRAVRSQGLPSGLYETTVQLSGYTITVTGKVINGVARIGTAYIP